jgi:hypothetical protein
VNSWNAGRSYASSSSVTMDNKNKCCSQNTQNSMEKLIHTPNKTYLQPNQWPSKSPEIRNNSNKKSPKLCEHATADIINRTGLKSMSGRNQ